MTYREFYAQNAAYRAKHGYAPLAADAVIGKNYRALAKKGGYLAGELVKSEEDWAQKEAAKKAAQQARTSA